MLGDSPAYTRIPLRIDTEYEHEHISYPPFLSVRMRRRVKSGIYVACVLGILYYVATAFGWTTLDLGRYVPESLSIDPTSKPTSEKEWMKRGERVKGAFLHAWNAYETYAWGADELKPIQRKKVDNFNGWGLTIYDSLSTLHLMNLTSESARAMAYISEQNYFTLSPLNNGNKPHRYAPFFETVIRYLGSMLSTYAMTGNPVLLARAEELGAKLLPVFDTPSGLPRYGVDIDTGETIDSDRSQPNRTLLAEIASCQMEYKYLAHLTGKREYFDKVNRVIDIMEERQHKDLGNGNGMWPTVWNVSSGQPMNSHYAIGAWADSAYEYLLKGYLLSGRTEKRLLQMYKDAMSTLLSTLLFLSPTRQFLYVTDRGNPSPRYTTTRPTRKFEHLSCFLPGLLALGAEVLSVERGEVSAEEVEMWKWAAEGLGWGCLLMYFDQPTGIGPEGVLVDLYTGHGHKDGSWMDAVKEWEKNGGRTDEKGNGKPPGVGVLPPAVRNYGKLKTQVKTDYIVSYDKYLMRPETIESLYVLYRTTRDPKWREAGWDIFLALETFTKLDGSKGGAGYSSVRGVSYMTTWMDEMPSYALAETWKYLYLLCLGVEGDRDLVPMDKWVFTTEAHPFPIFEWTRSQMTEWEIR